MLDELKQEIEELIKEGGPQGINSLAKATNIPLSSLQRQMHKQNYFILNSVRKWDLPENIAAESENKQNTNLSELIDAQLTSMDSLVDMLINNINTTANLFKTHKPVRPSVAKERYRVDPIFEKIDKQVKLITNMIRDNINNSPEQYRELILNFDIATMTALKGMDYSRVMLDSSLTPLLLGEGTELSEEDIAIMQEYQKKR